MKFEGTQVFGIENALIGMRLPMSKDYVDAFDKSQGQTACNKGGFEKIELPNRESIMVSKDDIKVAKNLIKADSNSGSAPNSKFLRMIHVQVAITAPLYLFKELDTYKVGTTSNSTSTMHKIHSYPIDDSCFEMDDFENVMTVHENCLTEEQISKMTEEEIAKEYLSGNYDTVEWAKNQFIAQLEQLRKNFVETKDKRYWKELIRWLPESWLQTRMFDLDYATLRNIYKWRKNHKLVEWHHFCDWMKTLPLFEEFLEN